MANEKFKDDLNSKLSDPPRKVSFLLKMKLCFGGYANQTSWIMFGFLLILFFEIGWHKTIQPALALHGKKLYADGMVTRHFPLKDKEEDVRAYGYEYEFNLENGGKIIGESFSTDQDYKEGDTVEIEYAANNPDYSRIKGTRSSAQGLWVELLFPIFISICIIAMFSLMARGLKLGIRASKLMKTGVLTKGKLISKEETFTLGDNQDYNLTFEYNR